MSAQTRDPLPCLCCGRSVPHANPRQPLHLDCWDEHHSDPTGVWPLDHDCPFDPQGWHCNHEWLGRPESDTRECLICGVER